VDEGAFPHEALFLGLISLLLILLFLLLLIFLRIFLLLKALSRPWPSSSFLDSDWLKTESCALSLSFVIPRGLL